MSGAGGRRSITGMEEKPGKSSVSSGVLQRVASVWSHWGTTGCKLHVRVYPSLRQRSWALLHTRAGMNSSAPQHSSSPRTSLWRKSQALRQHKQSTQRLGMRAQKPSKKVKEVTVPKVGSTQTDEKRARISLPNRHTSILQGDQFLDHTLLGQIRPMALSLHLQKHAKTAPKSVHSSNATIRARRKGRTLLAVKFICLQSNFIPVAQAIQSPPRCCRFNSLIFYGLTTSILTSPLRNASGQGCATHHLVLCAYLIIPPLEAFHGVGTEEWVSRGNLGTASIFREHKVLL